MGRSIKGYSSDVHDIDGIIKRLLLSNFWPSQLRSNTRYTRLHDDHDGTFAGRLSLVFSEDGDGWVEISDRNHVSEGLRFRVPLIGGGISPKTRNALLILAEAIRLDNIEAPIKIPPLCQFCHCGDRQSTMITVNNRHAHADCARDAGQRGEKEA